MSDPTVPDPETQHPPAQDSRPRSGLVVLMAAALLLAGIGGLAAFALRGSVAVPDPLVQRAQAVLSRALDGRGDADLGGIELYLTEEGRPRVSLTGLTLRAADSVDSVTLPRLDVVLARRALLRGEVRPESVRLEGARLRLSRDADGLLSLAFQSGGALTRVPSLPALIAEIEAVFDIPALQDLRRVTLSDLTLDLADSRLRQVVTLSGGEAVLEVSETALSLALALDLPGIGTGASLRFTTRKGDPETRVSLRMDAVPAQVLARQSPVLAPLGVFAGPVSARFAGGLRPDGRLSALEGQLTLGAGALALGGKAAPLAVSEATATWRYAPDQRRMFIEDIVLDTDRLRLTGSAHGDIADGAASGSAPGGFPDLLLHADLSEIWVDPGARLPGPTTLARVMLDARWRTAARRLEIGQLYAEDAVTEARLHGAGRLELPAGAPPFLQLEVQTTGLPSARVLDFWPVSGRGEKAGAWLRENLTGGILDNVTATLMATPGERPKLAASFDLRDAAARVLPQFPTLMAGSAHGTLFEHEFNIRVSEGEMVVPDRGPVDLAGSSFQILDTRIRGGDARLHLSARGAVPTALALLDSPPISLLDRVALPPDRLSGTVAARAGLTVPLRKGRKVDLDTLWVDASLSDLRFAEVAPGRDFAAPDLDLTITDRTVTLAGAGVLQDVPLEVVLARAFDTPAGDGTEISGTAQLTAQGLAALGVVLPEGTVSGQGAVDYRLRLRPDAPPRLELTGDLAGLGLSIPALNWRKPASAPGTLIASLRLGPVPAVDAFRLSAAGLEAEGRITLREGGGGLDRMELDRLSVGDWLTGQAVLTGQGPGVAPTVALTGGRLDLRNLPRGDAGGDGARAPLQIALDTVQVTDDLRLTGVRGAVGRGGGVLGGTLAARVNGGAPVSLTLARAASGRQAVQVQASDAGAVLREAGVLRTLRGGTLDMRLEVLGDPRILEGQVRITDGNIVETPGAVQLLSAISIVGLLDQMADGGIAFSEIATGLAISPGGITLREGRATGPSLGITFEGVVMPARDRIDLQGVVSPFYALNALPGTLFARRGEGLVGVSYRLAGSPSAPQVQVNPLSLLTPGLFRDLFRRDPPDLTQ